MLMGIHCIPYLCSWAITSSDCTIIRLLRTHSITTLTVKCANFIRLFNFEIPLITFSVQQAKPFRWKLQIKLSKREHLIDMNDARCSNGDKTRPICWSAFHFMRCESGLFALDRRLWSRKLHFLHKSGHMPPVAEYELNSQGCSNYGLVWWVGGV